MKGQLLSKYTIFACFAALLSGCLFASIGLIHIYTILPLFLLLCLMLFTNRHNKKFFIFPLLIIVMLAGALEYQLTASRQSSLLKHASDNMIIEGVVAAEPSETEFGYKLLLKNVFYIENNKYYKCNEKLQLYIGKNEKLQFGDLVKVKAEVEPITKLRNFGDFNFEKYYNSKDIYAKAYSKEITRLAANKAGFIAHFLYMSNQKVREIIFSSMPQTEAALLYGILTGNKSDIDEEVLEVFSLTGLAHILSVSGLHIGFLVLFLNFILKPLKLNKQPHNCIMFTAALFYIVLIGAPVPAVRALLMLAVMLAGSALGRKYDLNASASFAAVVLLLYNPLLIHDPSYIISFSCIFSICFLHQSFNKALSFLPSWIRSSLALSLAVWIGITPVLIYYFNYISIINIILNVLAVPLAFLITLAGFAAVIVGLLLPSVALFIFAASYYLLKLLWFLSEKALIIPFAGFRIPSVSFYIFLLYYFMVLTLVEDFWKYKSIHFKRRYVTVGVIAIFAAIMFNVVPSSVLKLYFIDVGQGDCSIIRTPNHKTIVVDGGGSADWEKESYNIGDKITVPALLHIGVQQVDTVIVSHIHDDHLGGVLSILENFRVRQVILPASDSYGTGEFTSENYERLKEICRIKNIPVAYVKSNSIIMAGEVKFDVLSPEKPYLQNTDSDVNNNSLVFKLTYKDFDVLFTGDIQQEMEQRLLDKNIRCDVLKVAHHGSPYSSIDSFAAKADPELSIISVGRNNYGHPSKEVIQRLEKVGSSVYRTDTKGAVLLTTSGKNIRITTVR